MLSGLLQSDYLYWQRRINFAFKLSFTSIEKIFYRQLTSSKQAKKPSKSSQPTIYLHSREEMTTTITRTHITYIFVDYDDDGRDETIRCSGWGELLSLFPSVPSPPSPSRKSWLIVKKNLVSVAGLAVAFSLDSLVEEGDPIYLNFIFTILDVQNNKRKLTDR